MVGSFPAVLNNFNQLFLKLNRFICNQLPVLPDHRSSQLSTKDYEWSDESKNMWASLYVQVGGEEIGFIATSCLVLSSPPPTVLGVQLPIGDLRWRICRGLWQDNHQLSFDLFALGSVPICKGLGFRGTLLVTVAWAKGTQIQSWSIRSRDSLRLK